MATIQTNEGETLIVENNARNSSLIIEASLETDARRTSKQAELDMWKLYSKNSLDSRPHSRGDLTADTMEEIANLLVGYAVREDWAETRDGVGIKSIDIVERDEAKVARQALLPTYDEDWPEDASDSEKIRWMLDNMPTTSAEDMAAGLGCSRSLVSDVKAAREDD